MEPVQIIQRNEEIHLLFNTVLGVAQARALHAQLNPLLTQSKPLVLDAGEVEQVDTAAMQILTSFCQQLRAQGAVMRWCAVSPQIQQAGRLLGLTSFLGDVA